MYSKNNLAEKRTCNADTGVLQPKRSSFEKNKKRIIPNYMALAMSVLLIVGVFIPSYSGSGLMTSGYNIALYELTEYSDYTGYFLLAIGIFSLIMSVFRLNIGVILGGIGGCIVDFIQFGRYFSPDYANLPVSLSVGFYILTFAAVVLLISGFLDIPKIFKKL